MKVTAFTSSPRDGSNSNKLSKYLLEEACQTNKNITCKTINLSELNLPYCAACFDCQNKDSGICSKSENVNNLLSELINSDILVFVSPIYFFNISGQMKVFLDHWNAISEQKNIEKFKGKKAALVFTFAEKNIENSGVINTITTFKNAFNFIGIEYIGSIYTSIKSTEKLEDKKDVIKEAKKLGRLIGTTKKAQQS